MCLSLDGNMLWEKKFKQKIYLFESHNSEIFLQKGKEIFRINPGSGELQLLFSLESKDDILNYRTQGDVYYSMEGRFHKKLFKIIDRTTGKPIWKSDKIEDLIYVTEELIIALLSTREYNDSGGYNLSTTTIEAYNRKTFEKQWTVPLSRHHAIPWLNSVYLKPYLVYLDGDAKIVSLDCQTGEKVHEIGDTLNPDGRITNLSLLKGDLVYLTRKTNYDDFNKSKYTLHFCSIPDLKEKSTLVIELFEIFSVTFRDDYIISDSLYRTACFTMTGSKVWEKYQMNRTDVIDGKIYFSDQKNEEARLGIIDVPTGKEIILYKEKIKHKHKTGYYVFGLAFFALLFWLALRFFRAEEVK
jgi:outer membrane protein assembly factor BamB